jgi:flagellin
MAMTLGVTSGIYSLMNSMNQLEMERGMTMARLSTGKRINKASDDPAGLIALNTMNAELAGVNSAISNGQRARSMLNVADSTLVEVSQLTEEISGLAIAAQGSSVSAEEKAAYQAQIDASLDSIDRLVNSAEFNGKKIFNGANRINATTDDASSIKDIKVYRRNPNVDDGVTLDVSVTAAATYAYSDSASGYDLTDLTEEAVIQVTGKLGTATITLASGSTSADILSTINAQSDVTGVSATTGGGNLLYMSTEKGSESFVTVSVISGEQDMISDGGTDEVTGSDAEVTINGESANASGTEVFYNGNSISLSFTLHDDTVDTHTVTVNGGGATFQLGTDDSGKATIGMGNLNTYELGRSDLGYLSSLRSGGENSLTASDTEAVSIAKRASTQVATAAARIGSFNKNQVGSTINSLNAAKEGLSSAISTIGDTDYAMETANLQRQNIMMNASVSMLSIMSSQQQSVLGLLGGL